MLLLRIISVFFAVYFYFYGPILSLCVAGEEVGALGILSPAAGILEISGPGGATVSEILVEPNQNVEKGTVLLRFANEAQLQANLDALRMELELLVGNYQQQSRLRQLSIEQAKSLENRHTSNFKSYRSMDVNSQVPAVLAEREGKVVDSHYTLKVEEAKGEQERVDFSLRQKQLQLRIKEAERQLEGATVKAPVSGTILDVNTRIGASTGTPLLEMADLRAMQVVCDVFEGDLQQVRIGQKVVIKHKNLPASLQGVVKNIGRRILGVRKVAKVRVLLEESDVTSRFIDMEVTVQFKQ